MTASAHDALVRWLDHHPTVQVLEGTNGLSVADRQGVVHKPVDPLQVRPGRSLLHRAVQGKHPGTSRIVDTTAGFGRDALALVQAGHNVLAVERHPLMHALLQDLVERLASARTGAPTTAEWGTLDVVFGDANNLLSHLDPPFDVAYLDPMYRTPRRGKSRGPLQWLDDILVDEASEEGTALLQRAQSSGVRRVVVKRPLKAPAMASGVSGSIKGRTTRYDIYAAHR